MSKKPKFGEIIDRELSLFAGWNRTAKGRYTAISTEFGRFANALGYTRPYSGTLWVTEDLNHAIRWKAVEIDEPGLTDLFFVVEQGVALFIPDGVAVFDQDGTDVTPRKQSQRVFKFDPIGPHVNLGAFPTALSMATAFIKEPPRSFPKAKAAKGGQR